MTQYDDENNDQSDLPADLRKQLREKDKELNQLREEFAKVAKRDRERTLKDVFTEKGVKPGVIKFFPADAEVTEESVSAWLTENAELFGIEVQSQEQSQEQQQTPAPEVPGAYARLNALQSPSVSTGQAADLQHRILNSTEAELLALIAENGGGSVF